MADLKMSMKNDLFYTPIPNHFIDQYMTVANPVFVTIYILGFRHCFHDSGNLDTKDFARVLNILESDVINGWKYWETQGLIKIHKTEDDTTAMSIEFLQIPLSNSEKTKKTVDKTPEKPKKILLETKPSYSAQELEIYKTESEEINHLFLAAEQSLGKLLKYGDLNMLFGFYDWLRLPVDVIEKLLEYCASNGHTNMNYIEAVALDWAEKQLLTTEAVENYIQTFNRDYREILKAFGQANRNPTPKESEFMEKWVRAYEMPLPIILEACDKTMMALGKPNFKYTDKIVTEWFENNIRTLEDIKTAEDAFMKTKQGQGAIEKTAASGKKATSAKKNRFVNFEGRKWDYAEMEKMEQEYLNNIVKGK